MSYPQHGLGSIPKISTALRIFKLYITKAAIRERSYQA